MRALRLKKCSCMMTVDFCDGLQFTSIPALIVAMLHTLSNSPIRRYA